MDGRGYDCERRIVRGEIDAADTDCRDIPRAGNVAALIKARAADELSRNHAAVARTLLDGLEAAETARQAAPTRVVEEAMVQHLARVVRQLIPVEDRPLAAQWPLPGLPVPAPDLPALDDPRLTFVEAAIQRSATRIRETRGRLAGHGKEALPLPEYGRAQLGAALARMEVEHRILVDQRRTTMEQILKKEPNRAPLYGLHLAHAYFFLDDHHTKKSKRRRRGMKLLSDIRQNHPKDVAAEFAALSIAGFALEDGNTVLAQRLLSIAGPFDPTLSSYVNALIRWRTGDHAGAMEQMRSVKGPLSPLMTTHLSALNGALALENGEPAVSAQAWLQAMHYAPGPFAERARLNAAVALSEAAFREGGIESVPKALIRPTLVYALTQGRLDQATTLLERILGENSRDIAHLTLMVIDGLRNAGAHRWADKLLALACRRYGSAGPWRDAHKGQLADWVSAQLVKRIDGRLQGIIMDGVLVETAARTLIEPLLTARLEAFTLADGPLLEVLSGLGTVGFYRRVRGPLLALIERSTQPEQRRAAARALVDAAVVYGREAGVKGAPVSPWLDGAPYAAPRHPSIGEAIAAQGRLIGLLPFQSAERDKLVLDRAALRVAAGPLGDTVKELEDIIHRHPSNRLGLSATYLLLAAQRDQRDELAARYAAQSPGPAARVRALEGSIQSVFTGRPRGRAHGLLRQKKYAEAAAEFARSVEAADGDSAVSAALGAAVSWCLALHPARAEAAFRSFIERFPSHPQTTVVHLHRARLLHTLGRRAEAARAYEDFARQVNDSPDGAKALLRAIELYTINPSRQADVVDRFLQRYPEHPEAARLRVRKIALGHRHDEGLKESLTGPANSGACRGRACQQAQFWPR